jgi:hypothetical protein
MSRYGRPGRRMWIVSLAAVAALAASGVSLTAAHADTTPIGGLPATVSADPLPTWQLNGVVWSQAVVGNTVYVAGSFTRARPPGVAVGGAGEVVANNAFAYDITTGARVASFHPQLDAQSNFVVGSPDGSRVYFGGDFSTVDGQARSHIAAFDTATNTLSSTFKPALSSRVATITVGPSAVYAGGWFTKANGVARTYLAAFNPTNGALQPWAPTPDDTVMSMVLAPDKSRVIIGGRFLHLNGANAYGMGSVDATKGTTTLPWAANTLIRNSGTAGAIDMLRTDGTYIYGSGYVFGTFGSNFEGTFSADPLTGNIRWLNDCHGDTYDIAPIGQVLYVASHEHDCTPIGAFPDNKDFEHRATAFTTYATGMNKGPDSWGINFSSKACGTILDWFPTLVPGTYTGQNQAAWSVTGNSSYVAYGGEFPSVNGLAQQSLVRFAVSNLAPNKSGPIASSLPTPTAASSVAGKVTVTWKSTWDMDNQNLTYRVFRDGGTTALSATTSASLFWSRPVLTFVDSGLAPGSKHTYRVSATDAFGNSVTSATSASVTVSSNVPAPFASDTFTRTVASGWGSATVGGGWSTSSATPWAVANNVGTMTLAAAGAAPSTYLASVSKLSTSLAFTFSSNKVGTGGGTYVSALGRRVSGAGDYRAQVHLLTNGTVRLALVRATSSGSLTVISSETTVAGLTWVAGTQLRVRIEVLQSNPTTVRARVWKVGTTEPTGWTSSVTDGTSGFQSAGGVGVAGVLSTTSTNAPVVISVDDLQATTAG